MTKLLPWSGFWQTASRSLRWIWAAARRNFLLTLLAEIAAAVGLAVVLLCARSLANELTTNDNLESVSEVLPTVLCLVGALFVSGLSLVIHRELRFVVAEQVLQHLESEIIDIASSVDYERFEEQEFNDLLDRATDHGVDRAMDMAYDILAIANSLVASSALLIVLGSAVPELLPALLVLAIPFLIASRLSARLAFSAIYDLTPEDRLRSSLFSILSDSGAAKEVRVFSLRQPLGRRWAKLFDARIERLTGIARRRIILNGLASLVASAFVAALIVVVVNAAIKQEVTLADGAIAIVALQQLSSRIRSTADATGSLRESTLFLDDFEEFRANRRDDTDTGPQGPEPLPPFTSLDVTDLSFRYPGTERLVLRGVDLKIGAGEIVALVGLSGSGKSTLAHLLANLYQPTDGRITWDDTDIASVPRPIYWRSLGVIYQDYAEYPMTALENIAISDHDRIDDQDAVTAAAAEAGIDQAIAALPNGYQTMLSREYKGGADLSEGEWQRVAVARAFFRSAPFLILDEPASALDPLAERELYNSLANLSSDRSVLLISHRFSTVRLADRIYVLHNGRVSEHGSHDELMAADGHYATMFNAQAAGFIESVDTSATASNAATTARNVPTNRGSAS